MNTDPDVDRLSDHLPRENGLPERCQLATKVANQLAECVSSGKLPFTLDVFGGWGTGKTAFLALLAERLKSIEGPAVTYFNG